jgi:anaphase-promoting complex subunit 1
VFLASDEDGVALLCLVLEESQQLLSFHLHNQEIVKDLNSKPKLEVAWTIPAISAAPVVATHPRSVRSQFYASLHGRWQE